MCITGNVGGNWSRAGSLLFSASGLRLRGICTLFIHSRRLISHPSYQTHKGYLFSRFSKWWKIFMFIIIKQFRSTYMQSKFRTAMSKRCLSYLLCNKDKATAVTLNLNIEWPFKRFISYRTHNTFSQRMNGRNFIGKYFITT